MKQAYFQGSGGGTSQWTPPFSLYVHFQLETLSGDSEPAWTQSDETSFMHGSASKALPMGCSPSLHPSAELEEE